MGVDAGTAQGTDPRLVSDVARLLLSVAGRLQENYALRCAEFDLTPGQSRVVLALRPGESIAMRELADRIRFDRSNLTGVVDRLEERGLMRRKPGHADRRIKELELTADGEELRRTFWQHLAVSAGPLENVPESDLATLRTLLGGMTTATDDW